MAKQKAKSSAKAKKPSAMSKIKKGPGPGFPKSIGGKRSPSAGLASVKKKSTRKSTS